MDQYFAEAAAKGQPERVSRRCRSAPPLYGESECDGLKVGRVEGGISSGHTELRSMWWQGKGRREVNEGRPEVRKDVKKEQSDARTEAKNNGKSAKTQGALKESVDKRLSSPSTGGRCDEELSELESRMRRDRQQLCEIQESLVGWPHPPLRWLLAPISVERWQVKVRREERNLLASKGEVEARLTADEAALKALKVVLLAREPSDESCAAASRGRKRPGNELQPRGRLAAVEAVGSEQGEKQDGESRGVSEPQDTVLWTKKVGTCTP